MIKTKGHYQLSLDNGVSWISQDNLLVNGYFNENIYGDIYLSVGGNVTPVDYSNTEKPRLAQSDSKTGLTGGTKFEVDIDNFTVAQSQNFNFGSGHEFTVYTIGLMNSSVLRSRALLRNSEGMVYGLPVAPTDTLLARYTLEYTMPRAPIAATIDYKGLPVSASIYFVNPNKWNNTTFGQPANITSAGVGNGWSIDVNASLSGDFVIASIATSDSHSTGGNKKSYGAGFVSSLSDLIGTFDQIILCNGTAGPANALVLIQLSEAITKTDKDTLSLTLALTQEPE